MIDRHGVSILIVTGLMFLFAPLGVAPLFDKDEGAFAEATREMLVSGDYLMTYLNGQPRYDKPILIYWFQALSGALFGLNAFAMRLPSAIASALWAIVVYRFAREQFDRQRAFWAAFVLLTSLQVTVVGKAAIADALLNLFIALSMFDGYRYWQTEKKRYLHLTFAWIALGLLTKGPIAALIPCAVSLIVAIAERRFTCWLRAVSNPIAWLVLIAIALPWPLLAYLDQGDALIEAWIWDHTLKRASTPLEGHGGAFFYYVPVVIVGLLPFTPALLNVARQGRALFSNPFARFCAAWFLFVFVLFTLVSTKLPHYVVYGYTPLFLLMSGPLARRGLGRWSGAPVAVLFAVLFAAPFLAPTIASRLGDAYAAAIVSSAPEAFGLPFLLGTGAALLTVILTVTGRMHQTMRAIALGAIVGAYVNFVAMPAAGRLMQEPIKEAALIARQDDLGVLMYRFNMPSFLFYRQSLSPTDKPEHGDVVISKNTGFAELMASGAIDGYKTIYEKNGVVMARVRRD